MNKEKGRQWDGKSRISNETYRQRWDEIFKKKSKNGITTKTNKTQFTNKI